MHIENFNLLKNMDNVLNQSLTLIVSKNNIGKASSSHLLQAIISKKKLSFDDYVRMYLAF